MVLIGKIDRQTHLEFHAIKRVMWNGKTVAHEAFVDVAEHYEEACFFQFHVGIYCHKSEIAAHHLVLCMECHGGRVVGWCIVTSVVVAIYAKLHMKNPCDRELQEHIGVDSKLGQWQYSFV